jgi:molybdopterin converting factor subunit 1
MKIEVRYFASLADRLEKGRETVELEDGATVGDLWESLVERYPQLADLPYRPMAACDMAYTKYDRRLDGVREVAFLPPVSGG